MNRKLLARIKELFTEKLSKKPTWGRNESLALYDAAVTEAVLELLED